MNRCQTCSTRALLGIEIDGLSGKDDNDNDHERVG